MGGMDGMNIETVDIRQNQAASQTILDMEILDGKEGLMLMMDYAASRYTRASMEKYCDLLVRTAQAMITHNSQDDVTIGQLRAKLQDKKNFFARVVSLFRRKK